MFSTFWQWKCITFISRKKALSVILKRNVLPKWNQWFECAVPVLDSAAGLCSCSVLSTVLGMLTDFPFLYSKSHLTLDCSSWCEVECGLIGFLSSNWQVEVVHLSMASSLKMNFIQTWNSQVGIWPGWTGYEEGVDFKSSLFWLWFKVNAWHRGRVPCSCPAAEPQRALAD